MINAADPLAETVAAACGGDAAAVERLVVSVQDGIYGLALRMLWHPEDARDAAQDILIRIITHLSGFRSESLFSTWCFTIAANYLRSVRRSRVEAAGYTFESFEAELHEPAPSAESIRDDPEYTAAVEEVRVGCTLGMLTCLGREERLAYIIGEILEFDHKEAATILGVTPAAFRQRLARARKAIVDFTSRVCGIVDASNACRCTKRAAYAISVGRVQPRRPLFPVDGTSHAALTDEIQRLDRLRRSVALYRTHPSFKVPDDMRLNVIRLLEHWGT
jgi:RNA polymerase sigma factor (sigma-70 family)